MVVSVSPANVNDNSTGWLSYLFMVHS